MKLLLIHGRAQGGKDPIALKKTWVDTLKAGLEKSGLTLPITDDDIIFPYYGDLLDQLVAEYNKPVESIIKKGANSPVDAKDARFLHDFLLEVADNANIDTADIEAENTALITEKGPLNWEWVHSILKAIDRKSTWSEASIKKFTYDVFLYLSVEGIRQEINSEVMKSFPDEPCVVVGHSLGSVVSYNLLRDITATKVGKFITVGSPLGVNAVKKYLKVPIKMPSCVQNGWFNAFDERDVVALKALNKDYFNIDPTITNKNDVDNHTDNRHGIEGYLNDKDVALEIYHALNKGCD
jgi:hypothetical protein